MVRLTLLLRSLGRLLVFDLGIDVAYANDYVLVVSWDPRGLHAHIGWLAIDEQSVLIDVGAVFVYELEQLIPTEYLRDFVLVLLVDDALGVLFALREEVVAVSRK